MSEQGFEFIRPDEFAQINIEGAGSFIVNAKYDRIDYVHRLGAYMLKFYDDEVGLVTMHVDEATAMRVAEYAELPIIPRDFVFKSEIEGIRQAQANMLSDDWLERE